MRKQLLISLGVLLLLFIATALVVIYGKGYQLDFTKGKPELNGTGLLVSTSNPDGAQVYINDHLTTATNNTINLAPGIYKVRIAKEGYFEWKKTITVQKEVVAKADALLLPTAPKLESITAFGANTPVLDPSGIKIAFTVASQSSTKRDGIYVLNMNTTPLLTLQSSSTQIEDDTQDLFSTSSLAWTPDGQNLLASISNPIRHIEYLLDSNGFNQNPKDVTETLNTLTVGWNKEKLDKQNAQIDSLKPELRKLVKDDFTIITWSPDETKILYVASASAQLPQIITPPIIGANSTPQTRSITQGTVYIYDIKEDRNYEITQDTNVDVSRQISWLFDSKHILFVNNKKIQVIEYDGQNATTVYAGPFIDSYVFPWPNGPKFVILTNLGNSDIAPNLYTVSLH